MHTICSPVAAYRTDAAWYDIGTFGEYEGAVRAVEVEGNEFGL